MPTKRLGDLGLDRVTYGEHVQVKLMEHSKHCTGLQGNIICGHADFQRE